MFVTWRRMIVAVLAAAACVSAQETRGSIFGVVLDPSGAAVPSAAVRIINTETGVVVSLPTNTQGYFSAPFLVPGTYEVRVTADGFKEHIQSGLMVTAERRISLDIALQLGSATEKVQVTAAAPLLDTASANAATTLTREELADLPLFGNNVSMLVRIAPGVQFTSAAEPVALHDIRPAVAVGAAGSVGLNEFMVDGANNRNEKGRVSYSPAAETVQELKIDTANFDASRGHSSNLNVNILTRSGTNSYRGTLTWQHWQQRWNATRTETKASRAVQIATLDASGQTARADYYRNLPLQPAGRSNTYAAAIGGPVSLPKVFSGKDKLFFFASLNGYRQSSSSPSFNTVPTEAQRRGDFSALLAIPQPIIVYDPRTARVEGSRVVRTPFPGNAGVPVLNPLYPFFSRRYPLPNSQLMADPEGANNYYADVPTVWKYENPTGRIDWAPQSNYRLFGRAHWSRFRENAQDWSVETGAGFAGRDFIRDSYGALLDQVFVLNAATVFKITAAYNFYQDGNRPTALQRTLRASDVGLPAYIDQKAGAGSSVPRVTISGYTSYAGAAPANDRNRYRIASLIGELTRTAGTHNLRTGFDFRAHRLDRFEQGTLTGTYTFSNTYTRMRDIASAGERPIGASWAAFMMGVPDSASIPTGSGLDVTNRSASIFIQDDWRVNSRLTLSFGLRYEFDGSIREKENRVLSDFAFGTELPITRAAEAAYAARPIPGLSAIRVVGGSRYAGLDGAPNRLNPVGNLWMPRLGAACKLNNSTVVRAGYGVFYDNANALDFDYAQDGYSRTTSRIISTDLGLTFADANLAAGKTPMHDPFPIRADGTRFDKPVGNALGLLARAGRGWSYDNADWQRPRQQRYRAGIQRQVLGDGVVEFAYLGSYTTKVPIAAYRFNFLPREHYATGNARVQAVEDALNANVPNPFNLNNFAFLQTQNQAQYDLLRTRPHFTNANIARHYLLRPIPHMTELNGRMPFGADRYNHIEFSFQKRIRRGAAGNLSYTRAWQRSRTYFDNEFDRTPVWDETNAARPHMIKAAGVWELPLGPGKPLLAGRRWASIIAGQWQIAVVYLFQTGPLVTFGNAFFNGDPSKIALKSPTPERWFDTSGFVTPRNLQPGSFHVRVFPRFVGVRGDSLNTIDANLARSFTLAEGIRLQFRADLLNAANSVQWNTPNADPASALFGRTSTQRGSPRVIQLQTRLTF